MSYESLQAVVGNAVIDPEFRKGLLNGSRLRLISNFNLSPAEVEAVMAIHADTLEIFARQLDQWISRVQGNAELPTLPLTLNQHKP